MFFNKFGQEFPPTAEGLRTVVALLRKNATLVEALPSASSVELYDSVFSQETEEEGVVMDYYSLIGVNGDPKRVTPFPVLIELLGLGFGARDLEEIGKWLRQLPIRRAGLDDRACAICLHSGSTTLWIEHQERCEYYPYPGHDPQEVSCGCPIRNRCSCGAEWVEGEQPPSTPIEFQEVGNTPIILERLEDGDREGQTVVIVR